MSNAMNDMAQERIPRAPLRVDPLAKSTLRPRWSVMIPVYNCNEFLAQTLQSVLAQARDRHDMQIEVVDDASTEPDTEALVRKYGQGRVSYYRQQENVGSLRNFHTCLQRARGEYIHLLHGDDRIRPGFYDAFDELFASNPGLGAAFCRYAYIDAVGKVLYHHEQEQSHRGELPNFVERLGERQRIQYVSMVVKREVYEKLGSFYGVEYGEDWEMWMRIAAHYSIGYIPEVLAEYRKHFLSISGRSVLTGGNVRDLKFVMDRITPYLPEAKRKHILRNSRKFYGRYALRTANEIWTKLRNKDGVRAQVREGLSLCKDPEVFYSAFKLYTKMSLNL